MTLPFKTNYKQNKVKYPRQTYCFIMESSRIFWRKRKQMAGRVILTLTRDESIHPFLSSSFFLFSCQAISRALMSQFKLSFHIILTSKPSKKYKKKEIWDLRHKIKKIHLEQKNNQLKTEYTELNKLKRLNSSTKGLPSPHESSPRQCQWLSSTEHTICR